MNKKDLSESDIKAKFITPAILNSRWDEQTQLGREIFFTDGRIYVKGKLTAKGNSTDNEHILNIYKESELDQEASMRKSGFPIFLPNLPIFTSCVGFPKNVGLQKIGP